MRRTVFTDRRLGRFRVAAELARSYDSGVLRVMGKCVVLRAEHMLASDHIEYVAVSDHFRQVKEGEMPPEYAWRFTSDGDFWCEELRP